MVLSNETDTEVFQVLRSGNLLALGIFYDRYGEVVYRVALRMLGNAQEAEDLTQEVFLTLWRSGKYDSKRGSMLVFLTTLTRSKAIDRHRQIKAQWQRLQRWSRNVPPDNSSNLMDKVSLEEMSQRVREALAELPPNQKQILEMSYYDGLSQSEISDNLNMPLGTVKTHKRKGLLYLRQMLQDLVE
ncbi:sigma-70 family RNA polymerase sigma factor [Nostoc sp. CCY0012]|uniref:sigma-70 family RNA polymerase sigma factor n=1 Tax=Nostoc sp. CCY0012 TaxID=1056123 RepID=UPI0039C68BA8